MRLVYIAHALRGAKPYSREKCEENIKKIREICRKVREKYPDVVPISPVHAFSWLDPLDESDDALDYCLELLGKCHGLWVFGDWRDSYGVNIEIARAWNLDGIARIRYFDENTMEQIRVEEC